MFTQLTHWTIKIKMQLNSLTHQGDAIGDIFVCVRKCLASIDQTCESKNTRNIILKFQNLN